jgi:hypothetical protein
MQSPFECTSGFALRRDETVTIDLANHGPYITGDYESTKASRCWILVDQ